MLMTNSAIPPRNRIANMYMCYLQNRFVRSVAFLVTVTLTFDLISRIILYGAFEVGIQNLVCGCILGWQCVVYHFWVTVTLLTLTSDLFFVVC